MVAGRGRGNDVKQKDQLMCMLMYRWYYTGRGGLFM